ncbi:protein Lines homolog 1 isoform X2 [Labrus bergylta]|uniref:Lines homolog 1 n=1 Tax=Labrus bergylta TaxID=56723 RepID=A0A3Q3G3K3_9LABR|nr:protein Lines homolog 1 isoform X2 [Labrus bergylta]
MEHGVRSGQGPPLTQVYRCLLTGRCPDWTAAEVADVVCSAVCGPVPGGEDRERCHDNSVALSCMSVSLVDKIASCLTSRSVSPAVTSYCEEVLRLLLGDGDLMSQLVHLFQSKDLIVSHLAAKSVSTCVFYSLQTSGTICPVWRQTCVLAFHRSLPGTELDACLWSLTEVCKKLLKGAHQVIFGELLAAFDSALSSLCSKFLPEDGGTKCDRGTTLCLLLDLLEVLTASTWICGAAVCLKSQIITHSHSSALLETVSGSSEYFVKKRALLLLKRVVLQKAGEDWASGDLLLSGLKHEQLSSDMSRLAHNVLTAVAADWLETVQVESASFFGGTRAVRGEEDQKPDCVMLRAVSLLLLKSAELRIQSAAGTGWSRATEVYGYLQSLWSFLRRCSVLLSALTHRCCWISVLFGEQDDDMMEAAKASLSIFLHHRRCSGLEDLAELDAACASGNNPHCIFLLLLQSVSFDHSILLDFLISTETCFLEFLVRYLKYLSADWPGFTAACGRIGCQRSLQQRSSPASCGGDVLEQKTKGEPGGLRLVQYGSSDESGPEDMEVCHDESRMPVCENSRLNVNHDVKQEMSGPPGPIRQKQYESSHSLSQANAALKSSSSSSVLHSEQTGPNMAALSGQVSTSERTVLCLSQLRVLLTRLHARKLFPYNPSSLIKLLAQVENKSQHPVPVQ